MSEEYVHIVTTGITKYIEIVEPGGQAMKDSIFCTKEEASKIYIELGRVLNELGEP